MTDRNPTTTRRAVLAGTASLPALALTIPAAAETDDPAIEAARRWIAADAAVSAFAYDDTRHGGNWDDDPRGVALDAEERRCWQAMLDTPPTTGAGLALMLACFIFREEATKIGSHFSDPDSWYFDGIDGRGMVSAILPVLWESPAAAGLFPHTVPPCDADAIMAKVDAEREERERRQENGGTA